MFIDVSMELVFECEEFEIRVGGKPLATAQIGSTDFSLTRWFRNNQFYIVSKRHGMIRISSS